MGFPVIDVELVFDWRRLARLLKQPLNNDARLYLAVVGLDRLLAIVGPKPLGEFLFSIL